MDRKPLMPKPRQLGVKTLEFQLNIGVVPGYGHDNKDGPVSPEQRVASDWQEIGEVMLKEYGVYPAGVVVPGRTVYPARHGCPWDGEVTVTISGLANPKFLMSAKNPDGPGYVTDLNGWRFVVEMAAEALRKKLNQTTAYLTFRKVRFTYLTAEITS